MSLCVVGPVFGWDKGAVEFTYFMKSEEEVWNIDELGPVFGWDKGVVEFTHSMKREEEVGRLTEF
jgi:hypothetical protein